MDIVERLIVLNAKHKQILKYGKKQHKNNNLCYVLNALNM